MQLAQFPRGLGWVISFLVLFILANSHARLSFIRLLSHTLLSLEHPALTVTRELRKGKAVSASRWQQGGGDGEEPGSSVSPPETCHFSLCFQSSFVVRSLFQRRVDVF